MGGKAVNPVCLIQQFGRMKAKNSVNMEFIRTEAKAICRFKRIDRA